MAAGLAGDQWNEGDVSCSVVRRVVLPDAFFALDGLLETFLTVLQQMSVSPAALNRENERYLPFLLTTTFMMAAVKQGLGRETAHELIKEHATATVRDLQSGRTAKNDLLQRLAADPQLGLSAEQLARLYEQGKTATGAALAQVKSTIAELRAAAAPYPDAAALVPGEIL